MKNRNEGIGLSFFGDFLLGATKIARAMKGVDDATKWVPKNEKAKENATNYSCVSNDYINVKTMLHQLKHYDIIYHNCKHEIVHCKSDNSDENEESLFSSVDNMTQSTQTTQLQAIQTTTDCEKSKSTWSTVRL